MENITQPTMRLATSLLGTLLGGIVIASSWGEPLDVFSFVIIVISLLHILSFIKELTRDNTAKTVITLPFPKVEDAEKFAKSLKKLKEDGLKPEDHGMVAVIEQQKD